MSTNGILGEAQVSGVHTVKIDLYYYIDRYDNVPFETVKRMHEAFGPSRLIHNSCWKDLLKHFGHSEINPATLYKVLSPPILIMGGKSYIRPLYRELKIN